MAAPGRPRWTALALLAAILAAGAGKLSIALRIGLDSDNAQHALYFYDAIENGNHLLRDWYMPANSYLFTDYLFNFLLGLLMGMGPLTLRLAAFLVFGLGTAFLALAIGRTFGALAGLFTALVVLSLPIHPFEFLLQPCLHNGTVTMSFLLLLLFVEVVRGGGGKGEGPRTAWLRRALLMLAFFVVAALTAFSDLYLLAFFVAPLLLALATAGLARRRPASYRLLGALVLLLLGAVLAGTYLTHLAEAFGPHLTEVSVTGLGAGGLPDRLKALALRVLMTLSGREGEVTPLALMNLGLLIASARAAFVMLRGEGDPRRWFALAYFLASIAVLSGAVTFKEYNPYRYLAPVAYSFAVLVALALARTGWTKGAHARRAFVILCMVSAVLSLRDGLAYEGRQGRAELAAALQEDGLSYGYAEYWDANIVTLLTENRVRVRGIRMEPEDGRIAPNHWFSKSEWYHPSRLKGETFLVLPEGDRAREAMAVRAFGPPGRELRADGRVVLVWPYNILRRIMSVDLSDNAPLLVGREEASADGPYRVAERGERGKLVLSNPWTLHEGRYRAVFSVRAEGGNREGGIGDQPGRLAVYSGKDSMRPEVMLAIPPGTTDAEYSLEFASRSDRAYTFVVSASGAGSLAVRSILVEKY
jgi:hypothetical protein